MTNLIQVKTEVQAKKIIKKHLGRIYCPKCEHKHYVRKLSEGRYYCKKCRYKFSLKSLLGFKCSKLDYHHIWKEKLAEYLVKFRTRFNHKQIVNIPVNLLTYLLTPCSQCFT